MKVELLDELHIPGVMGFELDYFPELAEGNLKLQDFINPKSLNIYADIRNASGQVKQVNTRKSIFSAIAAETTDEYDFLLELTKAIEQSEFLVVMEGVYPFTEGLYFPGELEDIGLVLSDNYRIECLLRTFICSLAIDIADETKKDVVFIYGSEQWDGSKIYEVFHHGKRREVFDELYDAETAVMTERRYI